MAFLDHPFIFAGYALVFNPFGLKLIANINVYKHGHIKRSQSSFVGLGMESWPYKFHTLLIHFCIAARLSIARNWKISKAPSKDVIISLNVHLPFEYASGKVHLTQVKFLCQWQPWLSHPLYTLQL